MSNNWERSALIDHFMGNATQSTSTIRRTRLLNNPALCLSYIGLVPNQQFPKGWIVSDEYEPDFGVFLPSSCVRHRVLSARCWSSVLQRMRTHASLAFRRRHPTWVEFQRMCTADVIQHASGFRRRGADGVQRASVFRRRAEDVSQRASRFKGHATDFIQRASWLRARVEDVNRAWIFNSVLVTLTEML